MPTPLIPKAPRETAEDRMDKMVQKQAGSSYGMVDDNFGSFLYSQVAQGNLTNEDVETIQNEVHDLVKTGAQGAASAAVGGAADLTAFATMAVYNSYRMAQGHEWAWPSDMRDVPATSDWWGAQMGLSKEVTDSLAFIGGGLAIAPTRLDGLDVKTMSNALRASKVFANGKKSAMATRINAEKLYSQGVDDNEIWQKTGWFPFTDDAGETTFRFFISDADATVKYDRLGELTRTGVTGIANAKVGTVENIPMRLGDILDHPALFDLYPEIAGYKAWVNIEKVGEDQYRLAKATSGAVASFDPVSRTFRFKGSAGHNDMMESILHEAQHAIQSIEGWQGGASRTAMADKVTNYHLAAMMEDLYENPQRYKDLDERAIRRAFETEIGLDSAEEVDVLTAEAIKALSGKTDPDQAMYWSHLSDKFAHESARWLSTVIHFDGDAGLKEVLDNLDDNQLHWLSTLRYQLDLGEMEARLAQALRLVPQEKIERFSLNPHQLMAHLGGEDLKLLQEQVPELRRMEFSVPIESAITDASKGKVSDAGIAIREVGTEGLTEQDVEFLQTVLDRDPKLLSKLKEMLDAAVRTEE